VQFILQLKLRLYTIVHLLLEEFKNFSEVILKYTIIMSHNKSYSRSPSTTKRTPHSCSLSFNSLHSGSVCAQLVQRPRLKKAF